jgi:hypothetical protein
MWSTSSVPLKAIRVFGALLAPEVVTGLGRIRPMARTDVPPGWDGRTILTTLLDYVRATVHAKCEHLAESTPGAPRCPPPR